MTERDQRRTWASVVCDRGAIEMSAEPTRETEWTPLRAEPHTEEPAERRICDFFGKSGCRHGNDCKFTHIWDPTVRANLHRQRQEEKKVKRAERALAEEQHALHTKERARLEYEQRLLAAPVFVPQQGAALVPDPHGPEAWATLAIEPDELDILIWAYREGRYSSPRHSLSEGHPLPCMRFALRQGCSSEICCYPHYRPKNGLHWRKKRQPVTLLCKDVY